MQVAVAHAAAVEQRDLIQQRAVAVRGRRQPFQVVRQQSGLKHLYPGEFLELLGVVLMVRQRVVRVGHPELGERAVAQLLADHEGDDPRHVRFERQNLQVDHDLRVVLETFWNAAGRTLEQRQLAVALRLRLLDTHLDVTDRLEILVQPGPVPGPQITTLIDHALLDRVEQTAVAPQSGRPGRRVGAVAVAEEPLEHGARIVLHRQRRSGTAPAQGVDVGATVADVTGSGELGGFEPHLQ